MPDYDLDVIDAAFDEFRVAVAPRVVPASLSDLATIAVAARRRRRVQAAIAIVAVLAVIAVPAVIFGGSASRPATPPAGHPSPHTSSGRLPLAACTQSTLALP